MGVLSQKALPLVREGLKIVLGQRIFVQHDAVQLPERNATAHARAHIQRYTRKEEIEICEDLLDVSEVPQGGWIMAFNGCPNPF